jgi:hypothetical protein
MSRYHINDMGEARTCVASAGNCKFGSEGEHFSSADDARKAYEIYQKGSWSAPKLRDPISSKDAQLPITPENRDRHIELIRGMVPDSILVF